MPSENISPVSPTDRAIPVEKSYRVVDGIYILGSLEQGVTVYKQQVRAHNLVWALWELASAEKLACKLDKVAVVGAGIAGLTTTACILSLFENSRITLFEQLWDICPLQQGVDTRWLHPRIYDWPAKGSRVPGASLPVLNWAEGRASDVASSIVKNFGKVSSEFDVEGKRLAVMLGLGHLRISSTKRTIDWIAHKTTRRGAYFDIGDSEGNVSDFDVIILTPGFGLETQKVEYPTLGYWRNEQLGQPTPDGTRHSFLISGIGDGAITDLCRLTIERFRQDTIIDDLFSEDLKRVESTFLKGWAAAEKSNNTFDFFRNNDHLLSSAIKLLSRRLRKDTRVVLHLGGRKETARPFRDAFAPRSSFLNRLMLYLLYRCGAFAISMGKLDVAVRNHSVPAHNVICRHGADKFTHLEDVFTDFEHIDKRLRALEKSQPQIAEVLWEPGTFPVVTQ